MLTNPNDDVSDFPYRQDRPNNNPTKIQFGLIWGEKWSGWYENLFKIYLIFKVKNLEAEVSNNNVMFKIER
jgi:hypothetical protein